MTDIKFLSLTNKMVVIMGIVMMFLGLIMLMFGVFSPPPGIIDSTTAWTGGFCILMGAIMHWILPLATKGLHLKFRDLEVSLKGKSEEDVTE